MAGRGSGQDGGHRHDDSFELEPRPEDAVDDLELAPAVAPSVSNQGQEARADRARAERGEAELSIDDMKHQFAAAGAPPMPPPPAMGGDADRGPAAAFEATIDVDDAAPAAVVDRGGRVARKPPPLPPPPAPVAAIEGSPWVRRRS